MTDDFTDLENELKHLRPRSVPAPLVGRVAAVLAAEPQTRRGPLAGWRAWILPAAAAALLAVTVTSIPFLVREPDATAAPATATSQQQVTTTVASSAKLQPVRATNVLYEAVNEGIVYLDPETPARRMRLSYLDTITWEDPSSGASLQRSVPREEIYFVPVTAN
jgi:hypothetical protein